MKKSLTRSVWLKTRMRGVFGWLRGLDLNQRPLGYEPNELPGCSTPHFHLNKGGCQGQTSPFFGDENSIESKARGCKVTLASQAKAQPVPSCCPPALLGAHDAQQPGQGVRKRDYDAAKADAHGLLLQRQSVDRIICSSFQKFNPDWKNRRLRMHAGGLSLPGFERVDNAAQQPIA